MDGKQSYLLRYMELRAENAGLTSLLWECYDLLRQAGNNEAAEAILDDMRRLQTETKENLAKV